MSPPVRKISLSGLFLDYPYSGTWTYTRNLSRELASLDPSSKYTLALRRAAGPDLGSALGVRRPTWPFPRHESSSDWIERFDKLGWEQVAWPWTARGSDLMHVMYFAPPALSPSPLVVTVHDVIPLQPEYSHSRAAALYSRMMRFTARRAAAIIAVSNHAKDEIAQALSYPLSRIHVTYEAAEPSLCPVDDDRLLTALRTKYDLPDRFVLYLGGTEKRKNIETLIKAWGSGTRDDLPLVIVGQFRSGHDPLFPDIPSLVQRLKLESVVKIVPVVSPSDMAALYSAALLFCYPSLYEGFGLPPLEAMACGCPVIASNASSLPEVLGDAAVLLPPTLPDLWLDAIIELANDEGRRRQLSEQGRARAASYSWTETARQTLSVYDQVLEG